MASILLETFAKFNQKKEDDHVPPDDLLSRSGATGLDSHASTPASDAT
jgi:hypothetical protein